MDGDSLSGRRRKKLPSVSNHSQEKAKARLNGQRLELSWLKAVNQV